MKTKEEAIKFFRDQIAKEHMSWWKYKQKIEDRRDLFTVEKEALIDKAYAEYKVRENEYIDIIDSIYYEDLVRDVPIYNR